MITPGKPPRFIVSNQGFMANGIDNHSHSRLNGHMIVCVCNAVSDKHIRAAVKDGAVCMRDISRELGVGTRCGKCLPEARATLSASLEHCADAGTAGYFSAGAAQFA
jgi:bacterioferritin-associated ferredoxin